MKWEMAFYNARIHSAVYPLLNIPAVQVSGSGPAERLPIQTY